MYGLTETQFRTTYTKASHLPGMKGTNLLVDAAMQTFRKLIAGTSLAGVGDALEVQLVCAKGAADSWAAWAKASQSPNVPIARVVARRGELVVGEDVPSNTDFTAIGKALGWLQKYTRDHPPLRGRLSGDRLGCHGGAHAGLGVLRLRRPLHDHLLRGLALGLEPGRLALLARDAGLRRFDRRPLPGGPRGSRRSDPARAAARQVRG